LGNGEFVVHGIVRDPMHGSPQKAALPIDPANWLCSIDRHTGEDRNLRVSHSIGNQNLLAFGVIR